MQDQEIIVGEEPKEMFLVSFIKHFNISRENFDKVVEKLKTISNNRGEDLTDERYELPNGDVIYTFDNDLISEYYRRE